MKNPTGRLARWVMRLRPYNFQINYRPGSQNAMADHLSRSFPYDNDDVPKDHIFVAPLFHATSPTLHQQQRDDSFCRPIVNILEGDHSLPQYRSRSVHYTLKNGILYRIVHRDDRVWLLLVIPAQLQKEVLQQAHDDSGHFGIARTYDRIHEKYFWPNCLSDVVRYCSTCESCQMKKNPQTRPGGFLQPIPVQGPFHTIGIDYCGPFTTSRRRNKYLLVAVDHLTKWVEAKAVPAATAANAAHFVMERIILRHGAPACILSDRGSHFVNSLLKNLLDLLGIAHSTTTSYNPQANGLTERMNKTLSIAISHYVSSDHKDWDELVPYITWCINTSKQETTKLSPFHLLYGRPPIFPVDIAAGYDGFELIDNAQEYVKQVHEWITKAQDIAKIRINSAHDVRAPTFNATRREEHFNVGDLVLLQTPPKLHDTDHQPVSAQNLHLTTKLLHTWHGPWKVLEQLSPVNYRIQNLRGRKKQDTVHVRRLKPYNTRGHLDDVLPNNPDTITVVDDHDTEPVQPTNDIVQEPLGDISQLFSPNIPATEINSSQHATADTDITNIDNLETNLIDLMEPDFDDANQDRSIARNRPRRNIQKVDYAK
jgi:hypothetical protein